MAARDMSAAINGGAVCRNAVVTVTPGMAVTTAASANKTLRRRAHASSGDQNGR